MAKSMEYVDKMEQAIIDALGAEGALDAITRALDYDTKSGYIQLYYTLPRYTGGRR